MSKALYLPLLMASLYCGTAFAQVATVDEPQPLPSEAAVEPPAEPVVGFGLEFVGLKVRTLDSLPVKWLTVKVTNHWKGVLSKPVVRVVDVVNQQNLYGGENGLGGFGFHFLESAYGYSSVDYLKSGDSGFISVNIGRPKGKLLKVFVTLVDEDNAEIAEQSIEVHTSAR